MTKKRKIWIKEYEGIISFSSVMSLLKKSVVVKKYTEVKYVSLNDIIICSIKDNDYDLVGKNVIYFENMVQEIDEILSKYYLSNYNLCYLESAINFAKNNCIKTIFTGSSYALFGIVEEKDSQFINCSLSSQDLYYSSLIIKKICDVNINIKNVALISPYYYFYTDLSKTKNTMEIERVSDIYYQLFRDMHNAKIIPQSTNFSVESDLFNFEKLFKKYAHHKYNRNYFTHPLSRTLIGEFDKRYWTGLSDDERDKVAFDRAELHNKNIKHIHTLLENTEIFFDLLNYLKSRNINVYIVVPPFTKYYRKYMNVEFKRISYEIWNSVDNMINIVDLYDSSMFSDDDFVDSEHLNDTGATKFTSILKNIIR